MSDNTITLKYTYNRDMFPDEFYKSGFTIEPVMNNTWDAWMMDD